MKVVYSIAEWLDIALDNIPVYENGRWHRHGDWGCRLNLGKFWINKYNKENHV